MRIVALENGPYLIETGGRYRVDGEVREGQRLALCRCGHSEKKPFCDGSHGRRGFQAPKVEIELG